MLFTRHKLDKMGEALIGTDPFLRNTALSNIQKWRETHFYALQELNRQLLAHFESVGISYKIASMRIKRMPSIEAKLRNNADKRTKLGGLQDIGGIRFVFNTIEELDRVVEVLDGFIPESFEVTRTRNYINSPKESGYRGVHYVYKYQSPGTIYDGLSIELQVRTTLQHAWAMAVETASLISNTTLKADIKDDSEWRGFFKLVSALFARDERKPVYKDFADYDEERLCIEYFRYDQYKLIEQLQALSVTVNKDFTEATSGYCVLTIDFNNKLLYAQTFNKEEEKEAAELFSRIETTINKDEAALMVAIEDMNEIKEAYPSYFLDTQKFLSFLAEFDNQCKILLKKKQTRM